MNVVESLNWRYATKKFDPEKKLTEEDLNFVLEVLRLSPSSQGLQAWKFIVVENKDLREKIKIASHEQPQVTDASHLIVLCSRVSVDEAYVDKYLERVMEVRGVALESLQGYKKSILNTINSKDEKGLKEWLVRQVYIALGVLVASCAVKNIDSCPMEGFAKDKVDEILGLEKLGLCSVVLCPVGYRAEDDDFSKRKKVRFVKEDVITRL